MASRFDMGNYDDPISELSKLRQEGTLLDYFEKFDQLLARVDVTEEMAINFFLGGLHASLEKSVSIHNPRSLQDAMQLARLQDEVLQELERKLAGTKQKQFEGAKSYYRSWNSTTVNSRPSPITNTQSPSAQSSTNPSRKEMSTAKPSSSSKREMSARIAKGLCRFCGEPWDKNHREKCVVWGKLSAIFTAQGEASEESEEEEEHENIIAL